MRTRKDFRRAAKLVSESKHRVEIKRYLAETFVDFFREENPAFDAVKFREACGVPKE